MSSRLWRSVQCARSSHRRPVATWCQMDASSAATRQERMLEVAEVALLARLAHVNVVAYIATLRSKSSMFLVQELFDITPDTSIKITVARWLGPDGKQIPHEGLTPDVQQDVSDDDIKAGKDPQMARAVQILTGIAPAVSVATSTQQ